LHEILRGSYDGWPCDDSFIIYSVQGDLIAFPVDFQENLKGQFWSLSMFSTGVKGLLLEHLEEVSRIKELWHLGHTLMNAERPGDLWNISVDVTKWRIGSMWVWNSPTGGTAYYLPTFMGKDEITSEWQPLDETHVFRLGIGIS
jgi:hypothetical protein